MGDCFSDCRHEEIEQIRKFCYCEVATNEASNLSQLHFRPF